jgi:hypothetical protein
MRINGFEQIKGFYSWVFSNQDKKIRTAHISLYMFLLNQNNRNGWVEWFKCPYDLAMGGSGITNKKTYYKCLNDLHDNGLIEYKKGANNWSQALVKLEVLYDTSSVPKCEPLVSPKYEPLTVLELTNNIKQYNKEQITTIKKIVDEVYESFCNEPNDNPIKNIYNKFVAEVKEGKHQQATEQMYMRLRIKQGTLTPLLKNFYGHLIIDNSVPKNTLELRKHFNNWLNVQDRVGKLDEYKK